MKYRIPAALSASAAGLICILAGCSSRTDVSLTGNTPAQYSHVFITAQAVWFNASAVAGPDDGGWVQFPLSTPATIDLVQESGGNLGSIVTGLKLIPGTYSQMRIIPVDASAALTTTASNAGALYNSEADYVDSSGTTHQMPLELLNPDKGIGIQATLRVPVGDVGASLASTSTTGTTTTGTTTGSTTDTTTGGTTTPTTTSTGTAIGSDTSSVPDTQFAFTVNGTTDLVQFTYGGTQTPAVMFSSHAAAYDLSQVGGISGTLTLTNLTPVSSDAGLPTIYATAEVLSTDGTRHEIVASTVVQSDGSFLLYPLTTSSSTPAYYDVVIHGPGIATMIVKSIEVTISGSTLDSTAADTDTADTTDTPDTTNSTTTTTAATTTSTVGTNVSVNAVSIGTLTPRSSGSYSANITTGASAPLPAGSLVAFYQTLARAGEVPYVIEASAIDPFNQDLFIPQGLSAGTVDSGTYSSTGSALTFVSAAPAQGAGSYLVAGTAPSYTDGPLSVTVSIPGTSTTVPVVTVPTLTLASGSIQGSISATVSPATAGKYNQGELLVAHESQLVATVPLNSVIGSGGTVQVPVPAENASSLYYLTVRAWNSSNPSATVQRQWYPTAVDMRSSASGVAQLTVN
jgi:hypothetical protein